MEADKTNATVSHVWDADAMEQDAMDLLHSIEMIRSGTTLGCEERSSLILDVATKLAGIWRDTHHAPTGRAHVYASRSRAVLIAMVSSDLSVVQGATDKEALANLVGALDLLQLCRSTFGTVPDVPDTVPFKSVLPVALATGKVGALYDMRTGQSDDAPDDDCARIDGATIGSSLFSGSQGCRNVLAEAGYLWRDGDKYTGTPLPCTPPVSSVLHPAVGAHISSIGNMLDKNTLARACTKAGRATLSLFELHVLFAIRYADFSPRGLTPRVLVDRVHKRAVDMLPVNTITEQDVEFAAVVKALLDYCVETGDGGPRTHGMDTRIPDDGIDGFLRNCRDKRVRRAWIVSDGQPLYNAIVHAVVAADTFGAPCPGVTTAEDHNTGTSATAALRNARVSVFKTPSAFCV